MKFSRKMREIDAIQEKNHYYKSDLYKMQIAMPYTETINDLQQKIGTLETELVKLKSRYAAYRMLISVEGIVLIIEFRPERRQLAGHQRTHHPLSRTIR